MRHGNFTVREGLCGVRASPCTRRHPMKTSWLIVVAGTALAAASVPAAAAAADQDRDRIRLHDQDLTKDQDRLRTRLHDMLKTDASLTDAELADVDPALT